MSANGTQSASQTDSDLDILYAWMPPQVAPTSCPEAALSLTIKGTVGGHEAMLTIRGQSPAEFQRNLEAAKGLLDPAPQSGTASATPQCPQHGAMKPSTKGKGFYCAHKNADGSWCKGK